MNWSYIESLKNDYYDRDPAVVSSVLGILLIAIILLALIFWLRGRGQTVVKTLSSDKVFAEQEIKICRVTEALTKKKTYSLASAVGNLEAHLSHEHSYSDLANIKCPSEQEAWQNAGYDTAHQKLPGILKCTEENRAVLDHLYDDRDNKQKAIERLATENAELLKRIKILEKENANVFIERRTSIESGGALLKSTNAVIKDIASRPIKVTINEN